MPRITPTQISDGQDLTVTLLNFGARIARLEYRGRNLACSYDNVDEYADDPFYLGATIGPITNRIHLGQLTIDKQPFQLPRNEGRNTLHSGGQGFDKLYWQLNDHATNFVEYRLEYELSQIGMVGTLTTLARYIANDGTLRLEYRSQCDRTTYINLTNHVYLNLTGTNTPITDHHFTLMAESFVDVDQHNIPTGSLTSVNQPIDYSIAEPSPYTEFEGSIDHHFNVAGTAPYTLRRMVSAVSTSTDIELDVFSDSPGFQFYTARSLSAPFAPSAGFCVETQLAPDAINQPGFYGPLLRPGERYRQTTEYRFSMASEADSD